MKFPEKTFTDPVFDRITSPVRIFSEKDSEETRTTRFELAFIDRKPGGDRYSFACDSAGTVSEENLSTRAKENLADAQERDWDEIEVIAWTYVVRLCPCGSGKEREEETDARGIFLTYACPKCRKDKLAGFRPEVLTDPHYQTDEPIDPQD